MSIVNELPRGALLSHGAHSSFEKGFCALEAASYIAGEPFSDHPECVCPVIANFLRRWNDDLPDDETRTRLIGPLLPQIIGTKSGPKAELARTMLVVDWFCREWLPTFLDLTPSCASSAAALRAAKPIQDWNDFDAIADAIQGAKKQAAAARDAAWDAAWDAARAAAWAAAWDAALAAARAEALDAALAAARAELAPTTTRLQDSAVALVERMCAIK